MDGKDVLTDAYGRIADRGARVLDGLDDAALTWRADPETNTIAWLLWHAARGQDAQVAQLAGTPEVWTAQGWSRRFDLPWGDEVNGYGQTPQDVGRVTASADLLVGYLRAVQDASLAYLATLDDAALDDVVDEAWDPPVTRGVRLVSIVDDDVAHLGQAELLRGMWERR